MPANNKKCFVTLLICGVVVAVCCCSGSSNVNDGSVVSLSVSVFVRLSVCLVHGGSTCKNGACANLGNL